MTRAPSVEELYKVNILVRSLYSGVWNFTCVHICIYMCVFTYTHTIFHHSILPFFVSRMFYCTVCAGLSVLIHNHGLPCLKCIYMRTQHTVLPSSNSYVKREQVTQIYTTIACSLSDLACVHDRSAPSLL